MMAATSIFRVASAQEPQRSEAPGFLVRIDNWDDYHFKTSFHLTAIDQSGAEIELGMVKIAARNDEGGAGSTRIPQSFDQLDREIFFSLGQSDDYYLHVASLAPAMQSLLLTGLNDIVADQNLFTEVRELPVTQRSLLRNVSPATVRGKFQRLLLGGVPLTSFRLRYLDGGRINLFFAVEPDSRPPSNIHVLIGRNGVGKTRLLGRMARALMGEREGCGVFRTSSDYESGAAQEPFASLALVSFSAFDDFRPPDEWADASETRFSYIGLKRWTSDGVHTMSPDDLQASFAESVRNVLRTKRDLWLRALKHLESDPVFEAIDVASLAAKDHPATPARMYRFLSSGHKIVLITVTRLVETVEERTLVLIDEPEAHLHPPLLSAFVRSLSDLLVNRNGVAIVATHSPVVLQEVPRECVWILGRSGSATRAERPENETFGENVGTLTHEVFGLEVTSSGFYRLLTNAAQTSNNYNEAVEAFDEQLGGEARAMLRSMLDS